MLIRGTRKVVRTRHCTGQHVMGTKTLSHVYSVIYRQTLAFVSNDNFLTIKNFFVDKGADINAENGCGATALHDAVNRGDIAICQELLQAGANPLVRATKG